MHTREGGLWVFRKLGRDPCLLISLCYLLGRTQSRINNAFPNVASSVCVSFGWSTLPRWMDIQIQFYLGLQGFERDF